jgi:hypothetical protein
MQQLLSLLRSSMRAAVGVESPGLAIAFAFCTDVQKLRRQLDANKVPSGANSASDAGASPAKRAAVESATTSTPNSTTSTTSDSTSAAADDTNNTTDGDEEEEEDKDEKYLDVSDKAAQARVLRAAPSAWARLSTSARDELVENFGKPIAALLRPFCADSDGADVPNNDLATAARRFIWFKTVSIFGPGHGSDTDMDGRDVGINEDVTASTATTTATTTTTTTTTTATSATTANSQPKPKATLAWAIELLQRHLQSWVPSFPGYRVPLSQSEPNFHLW